MLFSRKGQVTVEYFILTAMVVVIVIFAFKRWLFDSEANQAVIVDSVDGYFNKAADEIMGPRPNVRP